jgi:hypothetical protein
MICTAQLRRRRPVQERRVWSFKYVRATASNRSDPRQLVEVLHQGAWAFKNYMQCTAPTPGQERGLDRSHLDTRPRDDLR